MLDEWMGGKVKRGQCPTVRVCGVTKMCDIIIMVPSSACGLYQWLALPAWLVLSQLGSANVAQRFLS